jgi:hypothetical protein
MGSLHLEAFRFHLVLVERQPDAIFFLQTSRTRFRFEVADHVLFSDAEALRVTIFTQPRL